MNKILLTAAVVLLVSMGGVHELKAQTTQVCGTSVPSDATSLTCANGDLEGVDALKNLEKLNVSTGLTGPGLAPLAEHPTLEVLDLAGTSATDEDVQHLKGLPNLAALNLANTRITDEGLTPLGTLLVLRKLSLKATNIEGSGLKHIGSLPFLKWIDLSETKLTDEAISELARLGSVREMSLDGTELSVDGVERLRKRLKNTEIRAVGLGKPFDVCGQTVTVDVKTLTCEAGSTGGSRLKNVAKMTQLTRLTIRDGELDSRAMRYIRGDKLERLDLTGTAVDDRAIGRLGELPALRTINLSKTQVTDEGIMELADYKALREIFVAGTAVTPEGEAEFKRSRSGVRVVR